MKKHHKTESTVRFDVAAESATSEPHTHAISAEAIANRAYEMYLQRSSTHGQDQRDWLAAEQELAATNLQG